MAKVSNVNTLPATGGDAMWTLIATLVSAGWTKVSDSDGTTYSAGGTQVTSGASGAGGLNNTSAWVRLRSPGASPRELTIQRGTTSLLWRVKYSRLDQFSGGSPGAVRTPSATDEIVLKGGGTDAAPTYTTLFASDGTYRWHVVAFNTPDSGALGSPYCFFAYATITGTGAMRTFFFLEAMANGSFPIADSISAPTTGDADPAILGFAFASGSVAPYWVDNDAAANSWTAATATTLPAQGWYKYNLAGETATFFEGFRIAGDDNPLFQAAPFDAVDAVGGFGSNPYTGNDDMLPLVVGRCSARVTQLGCKGICSNIRLQSISRAYPDTVNSATDAKVYMYSLLVPFADSVAPLV